jgi:hypothetical protein
MRLPDGREIVVSRGQKIGALQGTLAGERAFNLPTSRFLCFALTISASHPSESPLAILFTMFRFLKTSAKLSRLQSGKAIAFLPRTFCYLRLIHNMI